MTAFTAIALMLAAQATPQPGNLAQELFYASMHASGSKLCDRKLAARLQRRFDARFGARISALVKVHEAHYGRDPDFIYTTDCLIVRGPYGQDRWMRKFEPVLRALERKYGGY